MQKYCSLRGIASRRKAEEYIRNGWIKVNGRIVAELGTRIDPEKDIVEISHRVKLARQEFKYVLLNKPAGYVTNLPNVGEKEAKELLPPEFRNLNPVGRLDKDSEGLLLFTDDGVLAHHLTSPNFGHEKEYAVTIDKFLAQPVIKKFENGIILLGERLKPVIVKKLYGKTYSFILTEGKNRQIRRMLYKFGYNVLKLKRVRQSQLKLKNLKTGHYKILKRSILSQLPTKM